MVNDQTFSGFSARPALAVLHHEPGCVFLARDPIPKPELELSLAASAPIPESVFRPLVTTELRNRLSLFTSPANAPPLNWSFGLQCVITGLALALLWSIAGLPATMSLALPQAVAEPLVGAVLIAGLAATRLPL
jgi:hypothetical protein